MEKGQLGIKNFFSFPKPTLENCFDIVEISANREDESSTLSNITGIEEAKIDNQENKVVDIINLEMKKLANSEDMERNLDDSPKTSNIFSLMMNPGVRKDLVVSEKISNHSQNKLTKKSKSQLAVEEKASKFGINGSKDTKKNKLKRFNSGTCTEVTSEVIKSQVVQPHIVPHKIKDGQVGKSLVPVSTFKENSNPNKVTNAFCLLMNKSRDIDGDDIKSTKEPEEISVDKRVDKRPKVNFFQFLSRSKSSDFHEDGIECISDDEVDSNSHESKESLYNDSSEHSSRKLSNALDHSSSTYCSLEKKSNENSQEAQMGSCKETFHVESPNFHNILKSFQEESIESKATTLNENINTNQKEINCNKPKNPFSFMMANRHKQDEIIKEMVEKERELEDDKKKETIKLDEFCPKEEKIVANFFHILKNTKVQDENIPDKNPKYNKSIIEDDDSDYNYEEDCRVDSRAKNSKKVKRKKANKLMRLGSAFSDCDDTNLDVPLPNRKSGRIVKKPNNYNDLLSLSSHEDLENGLEAVPPLNVVCSLIEDEVKLDLVDESDELNLEETFREEILECVLDSKKKNKKAKRGRKGSISANSTPIQCSLEKSPVIKSKPKKLRKSLSFQKIDRVNSVDEIANPPFHNDFSSKREDLISNSENSAKECVIDKTTKNLDVEEPAIIDIPGEDEPKSTTKSTVNCSKKGIMSYFTQKEIPENLYNATTCVKCHSESDKEKCALNNSIEENAIPLGKVGLNNFTESDEAIVDDCELPVKPLKKKNRNKGAEFKNKRKALQSKFKRTLTRVKNKKINLLVKEPIIGKCGKRDKPKNLKLSESSEKDLLDASMQDFQSEGGQRRSSRRSKLIEPFNPSSSSTLKSQSKTNRPNYNESSGESDASTSRSSSIRTKKRLLKKKKKVVITKKGGHTLLSDVKTRKSVRMLKHSKVSSPATRNSDKFNGGDEDSSIEVVSIDENSINKKRAKKKIQTRIKKKLGLKLQKKIKSSPVSTQSTSSKLMAASKKLKDKIKSKSSGSLTLVKQNSKKIKRKRKRSKSSSDVSSDLSIVSADDDIEVLKPGNKGTSKLAPIFMKQQPKDIIEISPTKLKAKKDFLFSDLPDEIKKQIDAAKSVEEDEIITWCPFPTYSHVRQQCCDDVINYPKSEISFLPISHEEVNVDLIKGNFDYISKREKSLERVEKGCLKCSLPLLNVSTLCHILLHIKAKNPEFPALRIFKNYLRCKEESIDCYKKECLKEEEKLNECQIIDSDMGSINSFSQISDGDSRKDVSSGKRKRKTTKLSLNKRRKTSKNSCEAREDNTPLEEVVPAWHRKTPYSWCNVFAPKNSMQVIENTGSVLQFKDWLSEWKQKSEIEAALLDRSKKSRTKRDNFREDSDSSDDDGMINTVLLSGLPGIGKSSMVYALAQELGYKVLEINASSRRQGKQIMTQLSEATQSHTVSMGSNSCVEKVNTLPQDDSNVKSTKKTKLKMEKRKRSPEKGRRKKKGSNAEAAEISKDDMDVKKSMALILIEDIDLVFEELDDGFLSTVTTLMMTSKRPIILTLSESSPSLTLLSKLRGNFSQICLQTPNSAIIAQHLQLVCLANGIFSNLSELETLVDVNRSDIRRSLQDLQLWGLSGAVSIQWLKRDNQAKEIIDVNSNDIEIKDLFPNANIGRSAEIPILSGCLWSKPEATNLRNIVYKPSDTMSINWSYIDGNIPHLLPFNLHHRSQPELRYPLGENDPSLKLTKLWEKYNWLSIDEDSDTNEVNSPVKDEVVGQNVMDMISRVVETDSLKKISLQSLDVLSSLYNTLADLDVINSYCSSEFDVGAREIVDHSKWRLPRITPGLEDSYDGRLAPCPSAALGLLNGVSEHVSSVHISQSRKQIIKISKNLREDYTPMLWPVGEAVPSLLYKQHNIDATERFGSSCRLNELICYFLPYFSQSNQFALCLDYLPFIRSIARADQLIDAVQKYRRGRRYLNNLKSLGFILSSSELVDMSNIFNCNN